MSKPKLLDLFCGAGGAAMGYHRAGFEVYGIDINPQPRYPFKFWQGDVMRLSPKFFEQFDVIHASPPCQCFTVYGNNKGHMKSTHQDLIDPVRRMLSSTAKTYVIENVPGAPLEDPIRLCGTSFPSLEVRRHRLFESNVHIAGLPCEHRRLTARKYPGSSNRPNGRTVCNIGEWRVPLVAQQKAIGIGWMSVKELSQAIPPAYTEYLGRQILAQL